MCQGIEQLVPDSAGYDLGELKAGSIATALERAMRSNRTTLDSAGQQGYVGETTWFNTSLEWESSRSPNSLIKTFLRTARKGRRHLDEKRHQTLSSEENDHYTEVPI